MKTYRAALLLLFGLLLLTIPIAFSAPAAGQISISVRIAPPALPVYEQPICPGAGYMWTPGYWAWSDDNGYYWVPGTWVEAPQPGLLWTPGYWGWHDGVYAWNVGYWGPHVGFYGGVNYGFGYFGPGFGGGEWRGHTFFYNSAVVHVNTTVIRNVYVNRTVIVKNTSNVAFNGGHGGIAVHPTHQQEAYMHERHVAPVAAQVKQQHAASQNRAMFASANHGRPAVAATARPGEFKGHGAVAAKAAGAPYHAPKMSPKEARASAPPAKHATANHAAVNSPASHPAANHPAASHSAQNHPAANHPAANHASQEKAANHSANTKSAQNTAHPNPARPNNALQSKTQQNNARVKAQAEKPASAPKAHEPTLRAASAKQPSPKAAHNAPRPEKPAAQPKHESAPPKQNSAPAKTRPKSM
jgi:hypothetical protein